MRIRVGATAVVAGAMASGVLTCWTGASPATAQPSCASLGGVIETAQMCRIRAAGDGYTMDWRFPVDYPDQQALTDYLVQNRDGFVRVAQMPGSHDRPAEMDATAEKFRSGQPPNGTQSVVLKIFQDVGGPRPSTWYKTFNYDLGRRRPVTFDNLFAPGSKPLDAIGPIVDRELQRQTGVPPELITAGSGADPSCYQNFAITNDEVIFYFAPGEVLPINSGATAVRVPRNAIPPLAV